MLWHGVLRPAAATVQTGQGAESPPLRNLAEDSLDTSGGLHRRGGRILGLGSGFLSEAVFVGALPSIRSVEASACHELKAKRGQVTPCCCGILVPNARWMFLGSGLFLHHLHEVSMPDELCLRRRRRLDRKVPTCR